MEHKLRTPDLAVIVLAQPFRVFIQVFKHQPIVGPLQPDPKFGPEGALDVVDVEDVEHVRRHGDVQLLLLGEQLVRRAQDNLAVPLVLPAVAVGFRVATFGLGRKLLRVVVTVSG